MAYPTQKSQYDFSMFEMKTNSTANVSTAPKRQPEQDKPRMRVVVNNKKKTHVHVPAQVKKNSVVKAGAVLLGFLMVLGMLLHMQAKLDDINRTIARTEQTLEETKSETVRLQMELNSIVSIDKVEEYAVNTLGMVKLEAGQVEYIDLSEGNQITVSGNKTVKTAQEDTVPEEEAEPEEAENADGGFFGFLKFWEYIG